MSISGPEFPEQPSRIRAFVAIELPEDVQRLLADVELHLRRRMVSALGARSAEQSLKWVCPEGAHITVKFLGYVAVDRISMIEDSLRRATSDKSSFNLQVDGLGVFPSYTRPRVAWVGVKGDLEQLAALQSQVEMAMADLGFPVEKRHFSPHLTLARVRETASVGETRLIGQTVREFSSTPIEARTMVVEGVSLMRSELSRQGARYTRLAEFPLSR